MKYTIISAPQGSPEWLSHRAKSNNASDLAAAMGLSTYKSRTALVAEIASGITPEIDAATQRRFDDGHRFEALARAYAEEKIICGALYPITVAVQVDGLSRPLSASLDGATDDDETNFEHKTLNADLAASLSQGIIPAEYHPQMEQGMLINGATRCLFMASKWDDNDQLVEEKHAWYESDPALRAKIWPTWRQIEADAETYTPPEVIPAAVATPQMQLPAVSVQVNGGVAVVDNLTVFGDALRAYVERINKEPATDQDFADLEATVKTLKAAEDALEAAKASALGQVQSIDTMKRTADQLQELARANRLIIEKLVKAEKENRKNAIIQAGKAALDQHIAGLNARLGKPYMPEIVADFAGKTKGLKTISSIQNAVDTELARVKIEANEIADRIEINLNFLRENAADYKFLFADEATIVLKPKDDFEALAKLRIAEHKEAEAKRLEAETARIRAEEEARAAAKVKAEQEEAARIAAQATAAVAPVVDALMDKMMAPAVVQPVADTGKTIKLGEINAALGFTVTAEFLGLLGFHATVERNARLYREADFQRICAAIARHCDTVGLTQRRAA